MSIDMKWSPTKVSQLTKSVDNNKSAQASTPATSSKLTDQKIRVKTKAPASVPSAHIDQAPTTKSLESSQRVRRAVVSTSSRTICRASEEIPCHDDEPFEGFADAPPSDKSNEDNQTVRSELGKAGPSQYRSTTIHASSLKEHGQKDFRVGATSGKMNRRNMLSIEKTLNDLELETRIAMQRVNASESCRAAENRDEKDFTKLEKKRLNTQRKNEQRKEKKQQALVEQDKTVLTSIPAVGATTSHDLESEVERGLDIGQLASMADGVDNEADSSSAKKLSGSRRRPTRAVKLIPSIEHDDTEVALDAISFDEVSSTKNNQDVVMEDTATAGASSQQVSQVPTTPRRSALRLPSTPSNSPPKSVRVDESQNQIHRIPRLSRYRRSSSPVDEISARRREKEGFSSQSDEEKDAELDDWENAILTQEQELKRLSHRSITSREAETSAATDPTSHTKKRKRQTDHDDIDAPSASRTSKRASSTQEAGLFASAGTAHDEIQRPEPAAEGRSIKPIKDIGLFKITSASAHGSDYRRAINESIRNLDAARKPRKGRIVRRSASDPGDSDNDSTPSPQRTKQYGYQEPDLPTIKLGPVLDLLAARRDLSRSQGSERSGAEIDSATKDRDKSLSKDPKGKGKAKHVCEAEKEEIRVNNDKQKNAAIDPQAQSTVSHRGKPGRTLANTVEDSGSMPKGRVKTPKIKVEPGESTKREKKDKKEKPKPITPPPSPKWNYNATAHSLVWGWKREKPVLLDTPVKDGPTVDELPFLPFHPNSTGYKSVDKKFKQELERRQELKKRISFRHGLVSVPEAGPVQPAIIQSPPPAHTKKQSEAYRLPRNQSVEPNARGRSRHIMEHKQQPHPSRAESWRKGANHSRQEFQSFGIPMVNVPTLTASQKASYAADPLAHAPRRPRVIKEQAPCPVDTWLNKSG